MSTLRAYRELLTLGGPLFVLVAFVGRLPIGMSQLGTLLLVAGATGSYGAGGATAGALAVANSVGAPIAGGLADRHGQRAIVLAQSLLGAVGLAAVVAASHSGLAWPTTAAVAAATGLVMPQVGPLARTRWRPLVEARTADRRRHARLVETAFSYEGAADEASFVLGPALVGLITALASPSVALLAAAATLAIFGSAFALHPTALRGHPVEPGTERAPLFTSTLLALAAVQFTIGNVFGSVQAGATVLATDAGRPGLAGFLHALLGVGSVLAGVGLAAAPASWPHSARLRVFTAGLLLLSLPLLAVDSLTGLALVLLPLGLAVAPSMITVFTLAERAVPARRLGAAMTVLAATTSLGYATGSAAGGRLADLVSPGHRGAFAVTIAATAATLALALSGRATPSTPTPTAATDASSRI